MNARMGWACAIGLLIAGAARGETLDITCHRILPSGEARDVRLVVDTDRRSVTEIWSNGVAAGKSYQYPLTEASDQFIRYHDPEDLGATRDVTIDRVAGTINVDRTPNGNGAVEHITYPCQRTTKKF